jgi:voltage-gated potassium channel
VVVDRDPQRLADLETALGAEVLHVVGQATDDEALRAAGIERARGVLVMLHDDRDNLFCTLSARALAPTTKIVSKAVEHANVPKLMRAGADRVVSPNHIGGMRLVSEMIRPSVVEFLDTMLRGSEDLRVEEVALPAGSPFVDRAIGESGLRERTTGLVLAVREPSGVYHFNPASSYVVAPASTLIVMAQVAEVQRLRGVVVTEARPGALTPTADQRGSST